MHLLIATPDHFEKLMESHSAFEQTYHLKVMEGYLAFPEVLPIFRTWLLENPKKLHKWWAYLVLDAPKAALIGSVGYRGVPQDGVVEVGCSIATALHGQGLATKAVKKLIQKAFRHKNVQKVIAHTLPDNKASIGVLKNCGMQYMGEVIDPEDGLVWKWEISKSKN
jgi:[ribosomal protein S5]-alanine N-acetyltransferase